MKEKLFELSVKPFLMMDNFKDKLKEEKGLAATEYALVMGIVVVGILGAATLLFEPLQTFFTNVGNKIRDMVQ
jgi:Flp pilus assembly pilin Flp